MTTLKIKIETDSNFTPLLREGNKIVRIAFNLFKKREIIINQAIKIIKEEYKIDYDLVDASMIEMFVNDAYGLFKSYKETSRDKIIFGSLKEWKRYHKELISKEEFNKIKNSKPLLFIGRSSDVKGNRKFELFKNGIIFKPNRHNHHILKLKTTNSRLKMLQRLQIISETTKTPITYRLNQDYVWITFDESILKEKDHEFIENRIGSLDLNPNYIAFTIQDFEDNTPTQIYKTVFDLTELNKTFDKNKKDYEIIHISKTISELARHYKCEIIGLEQLTMTSKDHKKGKRLNRLINNSWNRNCFINNLKKRLNILGIKNQEIICAYSSTVGCLDNPNETDSIAAALEIGRRTYVFLNKFINKNKQFSDVGIMFPVMDRRLIKERWNSILSDYNPKNIGYKGIHEYLKQQKKLNELRFLFKDYDFSSWSCFRHKSDKSLVLSCCC